MQKICQKEKTKIFAEYNEISFTFTLVAFFFLGRDLKELINFLFNNEFFCVQ